MSRKLYFFLSPCVRLNTNLRFLNCCSSHPQHFFYCFILWSQKKIKMLRENEKSEKIKFELQSSKGVWKYNCNIYGPWKTSEIIFLDSLATQHQQNVKSMTRSWIFSNFLRRNSSIVNQGTSTLFCRKFENFIFLFTDKMNRSSSFIFSFRSGNFQLF